MLFRGLGSFRKVIRVFCDQELLLLKSNRDGFINDNTNNIEKRAWGVQALATNLKILAEEETKSCKLSSDLHKDIDIQTQIHVKKNENIKGREKHALFLTCLMPLYRGQLDLILNILLSAQHSAWHPAGGIRGMIVIILGWSQTI